MEEKQIKRKKHKLFLVIPVVCMVLMAFSVIVAVMFAGVIDGSSFGIVNMKKVNIVLDGYISNNETEKAAQYAVKVQKMCNKDEKVLVFLLNKIEAIAPEQSYEMIKNYCANVPESERGKRINEIMNLATAKPIEPNVKPEPDSYVSKPSISFTFNDGRLGHKIYYTVDGSKPTTDSEFYKKPFIINNSCTINVMAVNGNGEQGKVYTYKYIVDEKTRDTLTKIYKQAKSELENAVVGDEEGQCLEEPKLELEKSLKLAEFALADGSNTSSKLTGVYIRDIKDRLESLHNSVLVKTDKVDLEKAIEKGQKIIDSISDSSYKSHCQKYLTRLQSHIDEAEFLKEFRRSATQSEINDLTEEIKSNTYDLNKMIDSLSVDDRFKSLIGTFENSEESVNKTGINAKIKISKIEDDDVYGIVEVKGQITNKLNNGNDTATYSINVNDEFGVPAISDDGTEININGIKTLIGSSTDISEVNSDFLSVCKIYFNNTNTSKPSIYISFDDEIGRVGLDLIKSEKANN